MKIVLVSKCFLDIEQYVEFKMSILISPSNSLISSRWVTYTHLNTLTQLGTLVYIYTHINMSQAYMHVNQLSLV